MTVKHTLVSSDMRVFALCSQMELHRSRSPPRFETSIDSATKNKAENKTNIPRLFCAALLVAPAPHPLDFVGVSWYSEEKEMLLQQQNKNYVITSPMRPICLAWTVPLSMV